MIYYAPAKINLSLDVIKKRDDGYHELKMIMQTVSLYDEIDIRKDEKISLDSNKKNIPLDQKNLAWKAADLFFKYTKISGGCKIYIKKIIPDGAGLGGGSSDAAQVLIALNEIYGTNLTDEELQSIGLQIGADVPFFILKGTCLAEGIGEKLTVIENNTHPYVLIYKPEFSISTKWVYENLNIENKNCFDINIIKDSLINDDRKKLCGNMYNALEKVVAEKYSEIKTIKSKLINLGSQASLMTGSGSAVFGLFYDENRAKHAYKSMSDKQVFLVNFI